MSAFDRRHSSAEPDDSPLSRCSAISHLPCAAQRSTLRFRSTTTCPARDRPGSPKCLKCCFPTTGPRGQKSIPPTGRPRQIRCGSWPVTPPTSSHSGSCLAENPQASLSRSCCVRQTAEWVIWRSTVRLWKAGLDSDGLQAVLDSVEIQQVADEAPVVTLYPLSSPESHFSGSK